MASGDAVPRSSLMDFITSGPPLDSHALSSNQALLSDTTQSKAQDPFLPLALQTLHSLKYAHNWTSLHVHHFSPLTGTRLSRPLVSGRPQQRVYVHPDEQIEILAREKARSKAKGSDDSEGGEEGREVVDSEVEREWVLPTVLSEKWSLRKLAEVFDAVGEEPPEGDGGNIAESNNGKGRRGGKRILLATVGGDSTITYYIIHEGIVKPRQN